MPSWRRPDDLDGEELDTYRMLSGIWGVLEEFGWKMLPGHRVVVVRLYCLMMQMKIDYLLKDLRATGYDPNADLAEVREELSTTVRWLLGLGTLDAKIIARGEADAEKRKVAPPTDGETA